MGFGLYVYKAGTDKKEAERFAHKFYGYVDFKSASSSFLYFYNICRDQIHQMNGKSFEYVDEVYSAFVKQGMAGPFTISAAQFRHFKDLYLIDIYKSDYLDRSFFKDLCNYMDNLSELGGDKVLKWE